MTTEKSVWYCPKCGYKTKPQLSSVTSMEHLCKTDKGRQPRALRRQSDTMEGS